MKIYKGNILTIDRNDSVYRYLVEDKGRIVFVGNDIPDIYRNAYIEDLGNKALTPSFADTHQHFASFATFNAGLNVMNVQSNSEMKEMIRDFAQKSEEKVLIAFGASPYSVCDGHLITKKDLDEVCPNKQIMLVKYDGHACVVNSLLLSKLDNKLKKLRGYHPDSGEMNQEAFFAVSDYITNSISITKLIRNMQKAADYLASKGIGMVHSVSGVGFPLNADISVEKVFSKSLQNGFQIRVFPQSMDTSVATSRNLPRIGGCFACALDGCFGSVDAAMIEPYCDDPKNNGILYYTDSQVTDFCIRANRIGLQIEMHAIGDRAFDQATRALKAALDDFPRENHRHGIIHACLPTDKGIEICSKYGIMILMQSAFNNWKQEPSEYTETLLGKERNTKLNPLSAFVRSGCTVALGSDAPCTDPDPIVWIDKAVNHPNKAESVDIHTALRMATYNGYYATFDEKERGSLEVGKIADIVVLSDNPYDIPSEKLKNIKVERLILEGQEYSPQNQGLLSVVFNGLFGNGKY